MIRIHNDQLGRALHASIYERLISFCNAITPEIPAELVVNTWLQRLYTNDQTLHLLLELDDDYTITSHALIDVQSIYNYTIIYCHQVAIDDPDINTLDEYLEYCDKLQEHLHAQCIVLNMQKNSKAMERRYGYQIVRSTMIKYNASSAEHREQQHG